MYSSLHSFLLWLEQSKIILLQVSIILKIHKINCVRLKCLLYRAKIKNCLLNILGKILLVYLVEYYRYLIGSCTLPLDHIHVQQSCGLSFTNLSTVSPSHLLTAIWLFVSCFVLKCSPLIIASPLVSEDTVKLLSRLCFHVLLVFAVK